ncbi:MAG: caspase family protein [Deltaproteobacteria bacterium]|nr:caspase family protein [Deltaproteobacteria bacterium]
MTLVALLALMLAAPSSDQTATRRLALVVGNNVGLRGQTELRYAERDAAEMARVLETLGGTDSVRLVLGRDARALDRAFDDVAKELARDPRPSTVFFYYSGHADAESLLMNGSRYLVGAARARLGSLPAQLFVAFIDACRAEGTRAKGGIPVPVLDVGVYAEDAKTRGGVFITSSAPGELAQESDELKASFFTHYLTTGLRGAADESSDGRVSLEEAYRYAYERTLTRTSQTLLGPQHPTWDLNIVGRGQLVLTWLSSAKAYLVLPEALDGVFLVRSLAHQIVNEIEKPRARRTRIALEPGEYEVLEMGTDSQRAQVVRLGAEKEHVLGDVWVRQLPTTSRTLGKGPTKSRHFEVTYEVGTGFVAESGLTHALSTSLTVPFDDLDLGLQASYGASGYRRADGIDVDLDELGAGVFGQLRWPVARDLDAMLRLSASALVLFQEGALGVRRFPINESVAVEVGGSFGIEAPFFDPFRTRLAVQLGAVGFRGASGLELGSTVSVSAGIGVGI